MSAVPLADQLWARFYRTAPARPARSLQLRTPALPLELAVWRWLPCRMGVC